MPPDPTVMWHFLWVGYLFSVAIETPVLVIGLSARHPLRDRLFAGLWLTACTYPIVVLVFPYLIWPRLGYGACVAVSETFAPVAECTLFWLAFGNPQERFRRSMCQDLIAIVIANLASFLIGKLWF